MATVESSLELGVIKPKLSGEGNRAWIVWGKRMAHEGVGGTVLRSHVKAAMSRSAFAGVKADLEPAPERLAGA